MGSAHADGGIGHEGALSADQFDRIPYPELVHSHTHPDRLAVVGRLLSMQPASVVSCRILELACGTGVNLIAIAQDLPDSQFTGIDGSAAHAHRGAAIVRATGLTNVSISHQDIRTFDPGSARYDYIIAHGVYSWVEADVRDALLRVIRGSLAPQGLALVSYNTYPGWFTLRAVREMMLFHGRHARDPLERVAKGSEIVEVLLEHLDPRTSLYAANLAVYKAALDERIGLQEPERLASILYDELSTVNEPVFFHEFMRRVEDAGLQYVAEADLRGSTPAGLSPDVVQQIKMLASDLTSLEQYMDFLANRTFRQTLLCRNDVALTRTLRSARDVLQRMYCWTNASTPDLADVLHEGATLRLSAGGSELATDHALSKAALLTLAEASPCSMSWGRLVEQAAARTAGCLPTDHDLDILSGTLLRGFLVNRALIGLGTVPDAFTTTVSAAPRCGPLVRLLASEGQLRVPNGRHERVLLGPLARDLATHLDGAHGLEELRALYERRREEMVKEGTAGDDSEATFESMLSYLASSALLDA